jgi:hypothetical protein
LTPAVIESPAPWRRTLTESPASAAFAALLGVPGQMPNAYCANGCEFSSGPGELAGAAERAAAVGADADGPDVAGPDVAGADADGRTAVEPVASGPSAPPAL